MIGNRVFSEDYGVVVRLLIETRRARGVSQRALAARLQRSQSHVCKIEQQQRRIDLLEFYLIARALDVEPRRLFGELIERLDGAPARRLAAGE